MSNHSTATARKRALPFKPPQRRDQLRGSSSGQQGRGRRRGRGRGGRGRGAKDVMASDEEDGDANSDDNDNEGDDNNDNEITNDNDDSDNDNDRLNLASDDDTFTTNTGKRREKSIPSNDLTTFTIPNSKPQPQQPTAIPRPLLTRLLHESFTSSTPSSSTTTPLPESVASNRADGPTRISSEAVSMVEKYMDTFIREALARAVYEKRGDQNNDENGNKNGAGGDKGGNGAGTETESQKKEHLGFLEVEDLERIAPQLLLDF